MQDTNYDNFDYPLYDEATTTPKPMPQPFTRMTDIPQGAGSNFDSDTVDNIQAVTSSAASPNTLVATDATGKLPTSILPSVPTVPMIHVEDQKTSGTNGGTATSGSWFTRTLNTTVGNTITGASLSSNQVTLPAGTYICWACAHGAVCNGSQIRLQNITDTATALTGSTAFATNSVGSQDVSIIQGAKFTISGAKVFELQQRVTTTRATDGQGIATGFGTTEVYGQLTFVAVSS